MSLLRFSIVIIIILVTLGILWATGLYIMILSKKAGEKYNKEVVFFHAPLAFGSAKSLDDTTYTYKKIKHSELPNSITNDTYSLGFWFFVEEWSKKGHQNILTKGIGTNYQPSIYISKDNNNLIIKIQKNSTHDTNVSLHESIEIVDIPIKRWAHFYMNVESTSVNIYINGHLVKSHILQVPIRNNKEDIYINNEPTQFNGLLSKILYSNYVKENKDIEKIYNKGPYGYSITDIFSDLYNKNKPDFSKMFNFCNR